MSGVINHHLFRFMVSLTAHNRLKLEFDAMKKVEKTVMQQYLN